MIRPAWVKDRLATLVDPKSRYFPILPAVGVAIVGTILLVITHADPATGTVSYSGLLTPITVDSFNPHTDTLKYELTTATGAQLQVQFQSNGPHIRKATNVQLKGKLSGSQISVNGTADYQLEATDTTVATAAKTAVILFNLSDNTGQNATAGEMMSDVFTAPNSVKSYYNEVSGGLQQVQGIVNPAGDVFGYYTIPSTDTACSIWQWADQAQAAAQAATGQDMTAYDHLIFVLPTNSCTEGAALAEVGGKHTWIFVNANSRHDVLPGIITHEIGHNLGFFHADGLDCFDSAGHRQAILPDISSCQDLNYGDPYDVMGNTASGGPSYHMNNIYLDSQGWLPAGTVQTITANGDYTLSPVELPGGIRAIRLPFSTDPVTHLTRYYYLEYRQPYGLDNFNAADPVVNGVSVRITGYKGTDSNPLQASQVINSVVTDSGQLPNDGGAGLYTMRDGDTYTDASRGVVVKQLSHTASGVQLHIEVPAPPPPDTTPPAVAIVAPAQNTTILKTKTVTVNATDNIAVDHVELYLDGTKLATSTTAPYSFSLNPSALSDGPGHKLTAKAYDVNGNTATSTDVTINKGYAYTPLLPARLVDTRSGSTYPGAGQPLKKGSVLAVQVTGNDGVPVSGVKAVTLNLIAIGSSGNSRVLAYPNATPGLPTPSLQVTAGTTATNQVTVAVGYGGKIVLNNDQVGTADVVADVAGYYGNAGSTYYPLAPVRISDTRANSGYPNAGHTVAAHATATVQVAGNGGVPTGATAAVVEVTAVNETAAGDLEAYPAGAAKYLNSTTNFSPNVKVTKQVTVKLGASPAGAIAIVNNSKGTTNLVVDVVGYFKAGTGGAYFVPVTSGTIADTRTNSGYPYAGSHLGPDTSLVVQPTGLPSGRLQIPAASRAVISNLTLVTGTTNTTLIVYPGAGTHPETANLSYTTGTIMSNESTNKLTSNGMFTIHNLAGTADVVVDVSGYYY